MKQALLVLGLVLALAVGSTKRAEACGGGGSGGDYSGLVAAALVVGGTYAGVTVGMGIKDLSSDDHSRAYGFAETAIHAPIALLWGAAFVNELGQSNDPNDPYYQGESHPVGYGVMLALHGALAAHGIYTLVKGPKQKRTDKNVIPSARPYSGPPGMFNVGSVSANLAPTPMQNGAGLGLSGSF